MEPWKTLSRKTLYHRPPWLRLEQHRVQLPDGNEIPDWLWVDTPDFINVVARDERGNFLCFRQTKYAAEGPCLALVGGYLEPGENPLEAAQRETLEELGGESDDWQPLGTYAVDGNRGCGRAHFFLARDVRVTCEPDADDLEEQELVRLSEHEIRDALASGEFPVLPWAAALALALCQTSSTAR